MDESIKKYTEYCLNCKVKPCSIKGCPLNNDIPTFIRLTKEEKRYIKIGKITENIILGLLLCLAYLIPIFIWFAK